MVFMPTSKNEIGSLFDNLVVLEPMWKATRRMTDVSSGPHPMPSSLPPYLLRRPLFSPSFEESLVCNLSAITNKRKDWTTMQRVSFLFFYSYESIF